MVKAYGIDGVEIKAGDTVEIVEEKDGFPHQWLKVGSKKIVAYCEDRAMGGKEHIVVFFKTKSGKIINQGMHDKKLKKVDK